MSLPSANPIGPGQAAQHTASTSKPSRTHTSSTHNISCLGSLVAPAELTELAIELPPESQRAAVRSRGAPPWQAFNGFRWTKSGSTLKRHQILSRNRSDQGRSQAASSAWHVEATRLGHVTRDRN